MITYLKIFLGCKGTWLWACRQMQRGMSVYRLRDSGIVSFTYDKGRRKINARIDWGGSEAEHEWGISMEDVFATDFMIWHERTNYQELHRQTQMKCDSKSLKTNQLKRHLKPVAPKPIKPQSEYPENEIQEYMKNSTCFKEQDGSHGKRFTFILNNTDVAYIWFKYGLNGWSLIFFNQSTNGERIHIGSVEKLKSVLNIQPRGVEPFNTSKNPRP
jgi:hypothetical protein